MHILCAFVRICIIGVDLRMCAGVCQFLLFMPTLGMTQQRAAPSRRDCRGLKHRASWKCGKKRGVRGIRHGKFIKK